MNARAAGAPMRTTRTAIAATAITAAGAAGAAYATARGRRAGRGPADRAPIGPVPDTVGLLACPRCHGALDWAVLAREWRCPVCPRSFPVRDGIVHFIESQDLGPLDRRFAPHGMQVVTVSDIWRGSFYCLEFVTPDVGAHDVPGPQGGTHVQ